MKAVDERVLSRIHAQGTQSETSCFSYLRFQVAVKNALGMAEANAAQELEEIALWGCAVEIHAHMSIHTFLCSLPSVRYTPPCFLFSPG